MTIPPRAKSNIPLDRKNEVLILVLSGFFITFLETKKFEIKVTQCFTELSIVWVTTPVNPVNPVNLVNPLKNDASKSGKSGKTAVR